jgi:hypothetical protein
MNRSSVIVASHTERSFRLTTSGGRPSVSLTD